MSLLSDFPTPSLRRTATEVRAISLEAMLEEAHTYGRPWLFAREDGTWVAKVDLRSSVKFIKGEASAEGRNHRTPSAAMEDLLSNLRTLPR